MATLLVTGGAGFIGSNFVRLLLQETRDRVVVLDALTYAGSLESLKEPSRDPRFAFERLDTPAINRITHAQALRLAAAATQPDAASQQIQGTAQFPEAIGVVPPALAADALNRCKRLFGWKAGSHAARIDEAAAEVHAGPVAGFAAG